MGTPKDLKPVLAKIQHQNSLGLSQWYEVVYFDDMCDKTWKSYAGSKTFEDGERVVAWGYADEVELREHGCDQ